MQIRMCVIKCSTMQCNAIACHSVGCCAPVRPLDHSVTVCETAEVLVWHVGALGQQAAAAAICMVHCRHEGLVSHAGTMSPLNACTVTHCLI